MSEEKLTRAAVVTGGSRGIGRAVCVALAKQGCNVVVNYCHGEAAAAETAALCKELGVEAVTVQADVSTAEGCKKLFEEAGNAFGRVDILVNNAGVTRDNLILRLSEEDFDTVLNANLKGAFLCCKEAARRMVRQRYGRIVNLSSVVGLRGNAGQTNYSASKAGLIGLTKSLAKELASRNVTVNAVAPGFIDIHTHSDACPLVDYEPESKLHQGITTEITGNCGISILPSTPESRDEIGRYFFSQLELPAGSLPQLGVSGREEYAHELADTVQALRCHPCIACWVPFNEGWGQFDAGKAVQALRTLDGTRLVDEASGWFDRGGGDVYSIHNYFYPLRIRPNVRTVALSEYGGIAWPMPGHKPPRKTYGYGTAKSRAELTERYCDLQRKTILPQLKKGLSALVYTQLTDVEDEVNGLFTYDRTAIKPDAAAVRAVNEALEAEFEKAVKE